jgi:hypothetical protein
MERPQIVWRKDENGKTIKTAHANVQIEIEWFGWV